MTATTEYRPAASPLKRGWINTYYRTYKGKKLGPYYVRRWKVGKKLFREYIKPKDVERVTAECKARRDRRKEISRFLHNVEFLGKMLNRYDAGKIVTPAMEAYIRRIYDEGHYITGQPQMGRRVTRHLALVAGETVIVKSVVELDGTTKVFMVPFLFNRSKARTWNELIEEKWQQFTDSMLDVWHKVNSPGRAAEMSMVCSTEGHKKPPLSRNPWLQRAF